MALRCALLTVVVGDDGTVGADQDARLAVEEMRRNDHAIESGAHLAIEVSGTAHPLDAAQGESTWRYDLYWAGDAFAFESKLIDRDAPVYVAPGEGGYESMDYDADGNLILFYGDDRVIGYFGPDMNERVTWWASRYVSPTGDVVVSEQRRIHELFKMGDRNHWFPLEQPFLAVGFGLSRHLDACELATIEKNGRLTFSGDGSDRQSISYGRWEITFDDQRRDLPRLAAFYSPNVAVPTIQIETAGSVADGEFRLAKRGSITLRIYKNTEIVRRVRVLSLSSGVEGQAMHRIRERLTVEARAAEETMDNRGPTTIRTSHDNE